MSVTVKKRVRKIIAIGLLAGAVVVGIAACGGSGNANQTVNQYPVAVQNEFLASCEKAATLNSGDPAAKCGCDLNYIEEHENYTTFAAQLVQFVRSANYWPKVWADAEKVCG